jgi:hypothetical protein
MCGVLWRRRPSTRGECQCQCQGEGDGGGEGWGEGGGQGWGEGGGEGGGEAQLIGCALTFPLTLTLALTHPRPGSRRLVVVMDGMGETFGAMQAAEAAGEEEYMHDLRLAGAGGMCSKYILSKYILFIGIRTL